MIPKNSIWRITAFWALCESGLGGLLHAIQLPFKGAILTFLSLLCITLITRLSKRPFQEVMRAMFLVILIKGIISPHSPITAYLAVAFQGVVGGALLSVGSGRLWLFLAVLLSFLETAMQKLLTLWLFFGQAFYTALNDFGSWVNGLLNWSLPGMWIPLSIYLGIYLMAALFSIWAIPRMISQVFNAKNIVHKSPLKFEEITKPYQPKRKGRRRWTILIVILVLLMTYVGLQDGWWSGLYVLIRSVTIIYLWFFVVGPWLAAKMIGMIKRSNEDLSQRIQSSMDMFPFINGVIQHHWRLKREGVISWNQFIFLSIAFIIWGDES